MLAQQIIASNELVMMYQRRAATAETFMESDEAMKGLDKATKQFNSKVALLDKLKHGTRQKMIVEKIFVESGAQAAIGDFSRLAKWQYNTFRRVHLLGLKKPRTYTPWFFNRHKCCDFI